MKYVVHLRIKAGRPGTPREVSELAAKLGLRKLWHSERLPMMVLFFSPFSHVEAECDIAASIASGAPDRRDGLTVMQHVDSLYRQLEAAHAEIMNLCERLAAGGDCFDELLDADDRALIIHRQLRGLIKSSSAAAVRFLELRGRIGGHAA